MFRESILSFVLGVFFLQLLFTSLLNRQEFIGIISGILLLISIISTCYYFKINYKKFKYTHCRYFFILISFGLGILYADFFASQRLDELKPQHYSLWQGKDINVIGVVSNVPISDDKGTRFELDIQQVLTENIKLPSKISVALYPELNQNHQYQFKNKNIEKNNDKKNIENNSENFANSLKFHAGDLWNLTIKPKKPYGLSNPATFNTESWLFQRSIGANATIKSTTSNKLIKNLCDNFYNPDCKFIYWIEQQREFVKDYFQTILKDEKYAGVLIALTIGDQRLIPKEQWTTFFKTGINHLVSISGLHVTMVAGIFASSVAFFWKRFPKLLVILPMRKIFALVGFLSAFAYSLLAGFAIPTQRTLYMLGVIAFALWFNRSISAYSILVWALLIVVLLDPWSVLSIGFWLSFGAVSILMYVSVYRIGRSTKFDEGLNTQWAVTIGLVPLLLVMFQQISLSSPIANLIAVPVVSFLVTPFALLGAIPIEFLKVFAVLAHKIMEYLMIYLDYLANSPISVWSQHAPPIWTAVIGFIGILLILAPKKFPAKPLSIILFSGLIFIPPERPDSNQVWFSVLDVGNGFSVLIQTKNYNMLYDAGVKFNNYDVGERVVIPVLRSKGVNYLHHVVISHDDSDHAGGLVSIAQQIPIEKMSSSLPEGHEAYKYIKNTTLCVAGQKWEWDGVQFEMLYPDFNDFYDKNLKDNDQSCTLKVTAGNQSFLLAGDIEKTGESLLTSRYSAEQLKTTVLLVPHHGSKTSSSQEFLDKIKPEVGIFSVGYLNKYRHPHPTIVQRYESLGIKTYRTDYQGMITVKFNNNISKNSDNIISNQQQQPLEITSYKAQNKRYWSD